MTTKIRISKNLYKELLKASEEKGRTVSEQLEICARLGMIVEKSLSPEEIEVILTTTNWTLKIVPLKD